MNRIASNLAIKGESFCLEVCLDPFNKRIRIDDYRGNRNDIINQAEALVEKHRAEKCIVKARSEHIVSFLARGFQTEAVVDNYFHGSDAYFLAKYYTSERKKNDFWISEDTIMNKISQLEFSGISLPLLSEDYQLAKADESHSGELSSLYSRVFQLYPTPLTDSDYVKQTMKKGTIYFMIQYKGQLVSAASAEINECYKNAELTDCATLPEYRQAGLMKILLSELETELTRYGIYCAYSLARSLSFGMNAALFQMGYQYRGRLTNNCFIYDKLENMNMWVKDLAGN